MDLKKYDELRKKISTKDFEGNNKGLDKWLFRFSFIGNISSIFFAYFLVYPSLLKSITTNFISEPLGTVIAFVLTLVFLSVFEITKRYFIRNFSNDFLINQKKIGLKMSGWFSISISIIILSFYLSITGSENLASTSLKKNDIAKTEMSLKIDSLNKAFDVKKMIYVEDNEALRKVNNDLRKTLAETPINYMTARKEYQISIDKNTDLIRENDNEIKRIQVELESEIKLLDSDLKITKSGNEYDDFRNKILFIIIVCFNEIIIIGGLYFREYFEYSLYQINQQKFEKIYQKKDRYKALTTFIYNKGSANIGDKVISGLELKELVKNRTNIQNKFVDEYFYEMDSMGIFSVNGKRRHIAKSYEEALKLIEEYDNVITVIEDMK